ncbi:hypothetical protein OROMI_026525 [Orobanche minor]
MSAFVSFLTDNRAIETIAAALKPIEANENHFAGFAELFVTEEYIDAMELLVQRGKSIGTVLVPTEQLAGYMCLRLEALGHDEIQVRVADFVPSRAADPPVHGRFPHLYPSYQGESPFLLPLSAAAPTAKGPPES